jgi:hypothetical protein
MEQEPKGLTEPRRVAQCAEAYPELEGLHSGQAFRLWTAAYSEFTAVLADPKVVSARMTRYPSIENPVLAKNSQFPYGDKPGLGCWTDSIHPESIGF